MNALLWILFSLTLLSLLEALHSLGGGFRFKALLTRAAVRPPAGFAPPASLIIPCRGLDPGFRENLQAFFEQDYRDFQLLLVTDGSDDPCVQPLEELRRRFASIPSRLLLAGKAGGRSQKVHNLLCALQALRPRDRVLAFADSDIRPGPLWLRHLAGTLQHPQAAAATGFRWYVPQKGNAASVMRAVWNAGTVSLLSEKSSPFAWGGAMAMRRSAFEECGISEAWQGALSDDYALSRRIARQGRAIFFQPHCLSLSLEDCSWKELLSWAGRQMAITRIYHPRLWKLALASQLVNTLGLWGGTSAVASSALIQTVLPVPAVLWGTLAAAVYLLGCWKAGLRLQAVALIHPGLGKRHRAAFLLLGPAASLITLQGLVRSLFSRTIEWRGIRYRMVSAQRTEVLD